MPKSVFTDAHAIVVRALVDLRRSKEVTQVELARRLGRSQQIISDYERGERRIDVVEFCAIVQALGGEPGALLSELTTKFPTDLSL